MNGNRSRSLPTVGLVVGDEPWIDEVRDVLDHWGFPNAFDIAVDDLGDRRKELGADVVLLGSRIRSGNESWLTRVKELVPDARLVSFAREDEAPSLRWAIEQGIDGVVRTDRLQESLGPAIQSVVAGLLVVPRDLSRDESVPDLTNREKQALSLVIMGLTNREIAEKLYITESTVKSHLYTAYQKLGVHSRAEAIRVIADPVEGLGTGILAITVSGLARGRSSGT